MNLQGELIFGHVFMINSRDHFVKIMNDSVDFRFKLKLDLTRDA